MTQVINDNLQINGDTYLKSDNHVSLHYGNRGKLGQSVNFNPDNNCNGLWLEASTDGSESGGIFCNGNTIVLWSPGDNDTLRVYDEDGFGSPDLMPKFVINHIGYVGIGSPKPQAPLHVYSPNNPTTVRIQSSTGFGAGRLEFWSDPRNTTAEWRPGFIQSTDQGTWTGGLAFCVNGTGENNKLTEVEVMRITNGRVGIGTTNPQATLDVNGDIKVKDWTLSVPDYVFEPDYELRDLNQLRTFIDRHKHLPDIPSAQTIHQEGVNLGEFCLSLLKKIEELSLYLLQQDEVIQVQNQRLARLERSTNS
ncbi:hypothetical protein ACN4EK_06010 [Pantanalinema rosaneae CENA516]|uniref:hypothetical protein n=1 Tax=Pantanalinema rosaneae TaxID=1620701 RepID=UPI003D6E2756